MKIRNLSGYNEVKFISAALLLLMIALSILVH